MNEIQYLRGYKKAREEQSAERQQRKEGNMQKWIINRIKERTTWDGHMLILVGLAIFLLKPLCSIYIACSSSLLKARSRFNWLISLISSFVIIKMVSHRPYQTFSQLVVRGLVQIVEHEVAWID